MLDIEKMVLEHMDERAYFLKSGETYVFQDLFDPILWNATTALDQYLLERALAHLLLCEDVTEIVFAGVNDKGQNLYARSE